MYVLYVCMYVKFDAFNVIYVFFSILILSLNGSFGLTCSRLSPYVCNVRMCGECALFGTQLLDMP